MDEKKGDILDKQTKWCFRL